jgi:prepilin-type N-terminal cleavage/methylation domain-containing protein
MRRRAFTLIELLVVIAIIAILAAILFPVFARAREKVRTTNCTSNLKNLSLALLMYVQDYDEKFPSAWKTRKPTLQYESLVDYVIQIDPYVKNKQIYRCPSEGELTWNYNWLATQGVTPAKARAEGAIPCSYTYYFKFYTTRDSPWGDCPNGSEQTHSLAEVTYPSQLALVGCEGASDKHGGTLDKGPANTTRGRQFVNLACVDGHARLASVGRLNSLCHGTRFGLVAEAPDWPAALNWTLGGISGADLK